jgi:hypothetical protein
VKVRGEAINLGLGRDFAGEEKPEEALRLRLAARGGGREGGLELRDSLATEANTLLGVEERGLPQHHLDATATADALQPGRNTHETSRWINNNATSCHSS